MHDPAADYCENCRSGGGWRLVEVGGVKHCKIRGLPHFERTDLRMPAKGARPFYCKGTQRGIAAQPGRSGLAPQIQLADAVPGIRPQTDRNTRRPELIERRTAMNMSGVRQRTMRYRCLRRPQHLDVCRIDLNTMNTQRPAS